MIVAIVSNLIKPNNIRIIIFLYVFAGIISLTKMTGGIKGFVHLVRNVVKTKKAAMFLTWLSAMGTFSDPDFPGFELSSQAFSFDFELFSYQHLFSWDHF